MDNPSNTPLALLPVLTSLGIEGTGVENFGEIDGAPASLAWQVANGTLYMPFVIESSYTLRRFVWANGATATGNVQMALYTRGGAQIAACASTGQSGASVPQAVAPTAGDVRLSPDEYYLALGCSSTSSTLLMVGGSIVEMQLMGYAQQGSLCPDPFTLATISTMIRIPLCGISDLTLI